MLYPRLIKSRNEWQHTRHGLSHALQQLPTELETGLDPPRIEKLLGESLRQRFQQSGLPDAARALDQSCAEVNSVQKQLANVLREVAHPDIGVIAKVRSANDSLLRSMTTRAQQVVPLPACCNAAARMPPPGARSLLG